MTEKVPAYEELESKIDNVEHLAALCSKMFNGCVAAYVSESETALVAKDIGCTPVDPVTIIDRLNVRIESITLHLMSIKTSGVMLENEIPRRITGKTAVISDEYST